MKLQVKIIALLFVAVGLFSCDRTEDLGSSNINVETPQRNALDQWIYTNFVVPYNIEVKYEWDHTELDLNKFLAPPMIKNVTPYLETVQAVWIKPYIDKTIVTDTTFFKRLCPKQLILVGSVNYNNDGSVTLGTAEGGRKVVLYDLNLFSKTQKVRVVRMLYTMQHEFAHILTQNKMFPVEFKEITPGYTSTWMNYVDYQAQELGYITAYARASPDEDFAEMVGTMLTNSQTEFDTLVNAIVSTTAKAAIRQKQEMVVSYYKEKYNIDFYQLQAKVNSAMVAVLAGL